jgi:hypothetical protein
MSSRTRQEVKAASEELRQVLEKAVEFNPVRTKQDVLVQVREARKLRDQLTAYNVSCNQARMKAIVRLLKQKRSDMPLNKPTSSE